jgi:hypothetical protein
MEVIDGIYDRHNRGLNSDIQVIKKKVRETTNKGKISEDIVGIKAEMYTRENEEREEK